MYREILRDYEAFDDETIYQIVSLRDRIEAQDANNDSLADMLESRLFMDDGQPFDGAYRNYWLFDSGEKDKTESVELHFLPLGNPMDYHNAVRLAILSEINPNVRIVGSGHPSVPFLQPAGKVDCFVERYGMSRGELGPMNKKFLAEASRRGVADAAFAGYSLGAELAATAVDQSDQYDIKAERLHAIEPPAVGDSLPKLLKSFISSGDRMDQYAEQGSSMFYDLAFDLDKKKEFSLGAFAGYGAGLGRLTNIAAGRSLSSGYFEGRLRTAADQVDDTMVMWGSESEVVDSEKLQSIVRDVSGSVTGNVEQRIVNGGHHAMTDDVYLYAAMVLEARHARILRLSS